MKAVTLEALGDRLDRDLVWRKKELTALAFLVQKADRDRASALLRGAVALLYAHWEGYVKSAASVYLEFVAARRLRNRELADAFLAIASRSILRPASSSSRMAVHLEAVRFFRNDADKQSGWLSKTSVDTRSNLSSKVLYEIVQMLGLEFGPFETKSRLIDETLLGSRNTIAHGEFLSVTVDRWESLHGEVLELLEAFRTQVMNSAVSGRYRR